MKLGDGLHIIPFGERIDLALPYIYPSSRHGVDVPNHQTKTDIKIYNNECSVQYFSLRVSLGHCNCDCIGIQIIMIVKGKDSMTLSPP
jgi:hypothetical protein